jgi:Flp pilus assembly pilin Flp
MVTPTNEVSKGTVMTRTRRRLRRLIRSEDGAATAEYAIATLAAVGFAGLLVVILRSDEVRGMLTDLVRNALSIPG